MMITIFYMAVLICMGWFLRSWKFSRDMQRILEKYDIDKLHEDLSKNDYEREDDLPIKHIPVVIRKEGEIFYVFEKVSGKFLAQGYNSEEIGDAISRLNLENMSVVYIADADQAREVGLE